MQTRIFIMFQVYLVQNVPEVAIDIFSFHHTKTGHYFPELHLIFIFSDMGVPSTYASVCVCVCVCGGGGGGGGG